MFDGAGGDGLAGKNMHNRIVRLAAAGSEDNFVGLSADELSDFLACGLDQIMGSVAGLVQSGGIAERGVEGGQ